MAIKQVARWRPQAYRSTTEAIVIQGAPSARVQTLQYCVYDDTKVGTAGNPYQPGSPETEQHLSVVDEVHIQMTVTPFAGKTNAQAKTLWDSARDSQIQAWGQDPEMPAKIQAAIGGALSTYVVIA